MLRRATAAAACTATLIALAPAPAIALTGPVVVERIVASDTSPDARTTADDTVTVRTSGSVSTPTSSGGDALEVGATLAPGTSLAVADASVTFVMQADGNAVLYAHDGNGPGGGPTALFHTATHGNPGARLVLQEDGNVVVYSDQGQALWHSGTAGTRAERLQIVDSRLLLTGPDGVLWHSTIGPFSGVVNDGLEDLVLRGGDRLCSLGGAIPWGRYCVVVQGDGNVVLYSDRGAPLWWTGTSQPGSVLAFQSDGNLVVYGPRGQALWQAGTANRPVWRWTMQDDGNVVAYTEDEVPVWSTGTSGRY